ncbi:MAG: hypothetical protein PHW04_12495 [Candidatus Wallbacteria bacterium]|nr:hypothetical protein [Candidatus Wallbacteria bacterium]
MSNKKCIGFSKFNFFLAVLLVTLKVHCSVPETAVDQILEKPLLEQIRLAVVTGEISLFGSLIDRITDKTAEVLLSAFNAGIQAKRLDALKYLLGRAEFPARDFSKESDPDLYLILRDSQDEELLKAMQKKGKIKLHPEMVPAVHSIDLAAELKLESWEGNFDWADQLCYVKSPEVAQYLIDHGHSVNPGYLPYSPLAWVDRMDVAEILIKNGAEFKFQQPASIDRSKEVGFRDRWSYQILPRVKTREIAELLISRGCRYDFPDAAGYFPIHCEDITPAVLELLLDLGMSPNLPDGFGIPPLFYCTDSAEKARILLSHGADPKLRIFRCNVDLLRQYTTPLDVSAYENYQISRKQKGTAADKPGYTLLHCARSGDIVRLMVESGLDPNARAGELDETPLHRVYELNAIKALIEAGADVNARDSLGNTPIFNNILGREALSCLIENGADPGAINSRGLGIMEVNRDEYNLEYLKTICPKGSPIPLERNCTVMKEHKVFQEVLEKCGSILKPFDFSTEKDGYYKQYDGQLPLLVLLDNRNDYGRRDVFDDDHYIYVDLIRKFLDAGGSPQVKDSNGWNLLMLCPVLEVARMMEKKGFDLNSTIDPVLDQAVREIRNEDMVRYLLEKGGPALNKKKSSTLLECRFEYVEMLVNAGFFPDATDKNGDSALLYAIKNQYYKKTLALTAARANPRAADRSGNTPLHCMVNRLVGSFTRTVTEDELNKYEAYFRKEFVAVLKALREAGADPGAKNRAGETALDMLRKKCRETHLSETGIIAEIAAQLK